MSAAARRAPAAREAAETPVSKRRRAREMAMQMLYQREIGHSEPAAIFAGFDLDDYVRETDVRQGERSHPSEFEKAFAYARTLVEGVVAHQAEIDEQIRGRSEFWRLERMPAIDRSILRLAFFELTRGGDVPAVVIVDEAIELAKRFGSESSGRFVNGVLAAALEDPDEPAREEPAAEAR